MIRRRTLWLVRLAGGLSALALAACVAAPAPAEAPLAAAAAPDSASLPAAAAQCYWLSNAGEGWVAQPDLADPDYCYELDSCAGGLGLSGGGCYKWAASADAPGIPWAEFGLIDMSQASPETDPAFPVVLTLPPGLVLAEDIPPPEEIYQGAFEITSDTCFEDCPPVPTRAAAESPLYERTDVTSPRVGTVLAGECVGNLDYRLLSTPRRGIVIETGNDVAAGDVIYDLAYDGEGNYIAWRRGEQLTLSYSYGPAVLWDDPPAERHPQEGYWLELQRADGTRGWARDVEAEDDYSSTPCEIGKG
jgi:hypothetical protein